MNDELMTVKARAVGNAVFIDRRDQYKELCFGATSNQSAKWIVDRINDLIGEFKVEIDKLMDAIEEM